MLLDTNAGAAPVRTFGMGAERRSGEQRATSTTAARTIHGCAPEREGGTASLNG